MKRAFVTAPWLLCFVTVMVVCAAPAPSRAGTAVEAWVQRYSSTSEGGSGALALDADGNVIVTGSTAGQGMLIIKYSPNGVALWTNRYRGPSSNSDFANAVAVDTSGNSYVAGYSYASGSHYDYVTLAYSSAGTPSWTNRYKGPGSSDDRAFAIAVGSNGNVYVTGRSSLLSSSSYDFLTVAYSKTGTPLWTNRYDGPSNFQDYAIALAVGSNGNVYVAGYSAGSSGALDFCTIAYSSAGTPLSTNRSSGPGNYNDYVSDLAVDSNGNVYVTGFFTFYGQGNVAAITSSSAGVTTWTNSYNSGSFKAIALGGGGNIYVTGYASASSVSDYVTVACSSDGTALWTNRYHGMLDANYEARGAANDVAVDTCGNVYVTGKSEDYQFAPYSSVYATIAYSSAGTPLWTNRYHGPGLGFSAGYNEARAIALDGNGNIYVRIFREFSG